MDFSKAIMNIHFADVDRIQKEIDIKLNDPTWMRLNNQYSMANAPVGLNGNQAFYFDFEIPNAIFIFAEIKKRFESKGWRVIVLHHQSKTLAKLQLHK